MPSRESRTHVLKFLERTLICRNNVHVDPDQNAPNIEFAKSGYDHGILCLLAKDNDIKKNIHHKPLKVEMDSSK